MTISRRKMFGFLAAAPVVVVAAVEAAKAEADVLSPADLNELARQQMEAGPLFRDGDVLYNGVIVREVDDLGNVMQRRRSKALHLMNARRLAS